MSTARHVLRSVREDRPLQGIVLALGFCYYAYGAVFLMVRAWWL